jgi:hypothetical protein
MQSWDVGYTDTGLTVNPLAPFSLKRTDRERDTCHRCNDADRNNLPLARFYHVMTRPAIVAPQIQTDVDFTIAHIASENSDWISRAAQRMASSRHSTNKTWVVSVSSDKDARAYMTLHVPFDR